MHANGGSEEGSSWWMPTGESEEGSSWWMPTGQLGEVSSWCMPTSGLQEASAWAVRSEQLLTEESVSTDGCGCIACIVPCQLSC